MKREFAEFLVASGRIDESALAVASGGDWLARDQIARLALMHGIIEPEAIDRILARQQATNDYFGQVALEMGLLNREQLAALRAGQAIRGCAEVIEDLVLANRLSLSTAVAALAEFLSTRDMEADLLMEGGRAR